MPIQFNQPQDITSREFTEHEWDVDMFERQAKHAINIKELDIQAAKLEAKITSWFRIPIYIISLPVKVLALIPLVVYAARSKEVPEQLWQLLR